MLVAHLLILGKLQGLQEGMFEQPTLYLFGRVFIVMVIIISRVNACRRPRSLGFSAMKFCGYIFASAIQWRHVVDFTTKAVLVYRFPRSL